jgi:competence protein ComEA
VSNSQDNPQGSQSTSAEAVASASTDATGRGYLVQAGVLIGVVAITVVITLWVSRDAERVGVEILIPTPAPVTFQVSGAVVRPGVYSLDGEPRVNDAIDAAGGLTADADDRQLNLAVHVRDGGKVVVPSLDIVTSSGDSNTGTGDQVAERVTETAGSDSGNSPTNTVVPSSISGGLIDLNTATKDQLIALPGIGDVRADSIIEWRANNLINSTSDLLAISGIGPATVDSIRSHVVQP